jgi:hypothetical protein
MGVMIVSERIDIPIAKRHNTLGYYVNFHPLTHRPGVPAAIYTSIVHKDIVHKEKKLA